MKDGEPTAERQRSRQRNEPKDTIGFERYGIIDETPYEAPQSYPEDARDYLYNLSRCGTMSGACKLTGISTRRVYELRKTVEGLREEEEIAKDVLADAFEQSLNECALGLDPCVQGMARVKALDNALQANKPDKYNDDKSVEVEGELTWLDMLKEAEDELEEEGD